VSKSIAEFHFLRPWLLLMILPAFGLWWLQRCEADTTARWRQVIDPALLQHLIVGRASRQILSPENMLLLLWLMSIVAVAGPAWRQVPSPFAQRARPAMFIVKVTASMLERDLAPTRLDRARQKIADLLKLREGAPTGLIAYAGSAHLVLPPTPDASIINTLAQALAPNLMPREGDALGDALQLATDTLIRGKQGGSIVVFADDAPPVKNVRPKMPPLTLFVMLPLNHTKTPALEAAASSLHADRVTLTLDSKDVVDLAHRLATAGTAPPAAGETARWEEAGYWLTPVLAVFGVLWCRRGWVLA